MVKTLATLAFIGAAAAGAVALAHTRTVIDGKVMAADLLKQLQPRGITRMECDDSIPITTAGAVFRCTVVARDGSTGRFEYTLDRAQHLSGREVSETPPTREDPQPRHEVPSSDDPWAN